ncbi:MAG: sigma-70 family RNA polymerase sigma factor [Deltaproteobacteria bacterium]|nr:sigma-70 family RNA polymerase sigma factor [Deltaproteobacteria bacterium]
MPLRSAREPTFPGTSGGAAPDVAVRAHAEARQKLGGLGVSLAEYCGRVAEAEAELARMGGKSGSLAYEDLYLAMGCQRGNEQAWRIFERSFGAYLRRLCIRSMGSVTEGEELLGDLYADLVSRGATPGKIDLYRGMASLGTWLAVIVRRMALDRLRLADRRSQRERSYEEELPQVERSTPESRLLLAESTEIGGRILREALDSLDPRHRLVLELVYWDGLTLREAGKVMGLDFSTVSRRLKLAREAVHKAIRLLSRRSYGLAPEAVAGLLEQLGGSLEPTVLQEGEELG